MTKRKEHQKLEINENGLVSVDDIAAADTMPPCGTVLCNRRSMPVKKGSRNPKVAYGKYVCVVCNQAHMDTLRHYRNIGENFGEKIMSERMNINKDKPSIFDLAENNNNLTEFIK